MSPYIPQSINKAQSGTSPASLHSRRRFLGSAALGLVGLSSARLPELAGAEADAVKIERAKDAINFFAGKDLVTSYQIGAEVAKPYFWPMHGPGGVIVTRGWPMVKAKEGDSTDHPHQKSAWFCHGDVIPEGVELKVKSKDKNVKGVDFWSENGSNGKIVCVSVSDPKVDKDHGQITTKNEWRTPDGMKLIDETRALHLYNWGDTRLLVLDIDLLANVAPLTFGDTKEGSMGIRINDTIREVIDTRENGKRVVKKGPGKLMNADGKAGEKEVWGQLSAWCDYSGPLDGKTVGLAILDDPKNLPPACWHSRGYGLMAANPFGRKGAGFPAMKEKTELFKLPKGEHLKLRYGLLIHPGDAKEGKVDDYYKRFVKLNG
jgi:hypothetical protein